MLELARNLIVKEISIARGKDEEKVLKDIEKPLRKAAKSRRSVASTAH